MDSLGCTKIGIIYSVKQGFFWNCGLCLEVHILSEPCNECEHDNDEWSMIMKMIITLRDSFFKRTASGLTNFFTVTLWFPKRRSLKPLNGHLWVQIRSLCRILVPNVHLDIRKGFLLSKGCWTQLPGHIRHCSIEASTKQKDVEEEEVAFICVLTLCFRGYTLEDYPPWN